MASNTYVALDKVTVGTNTTSISFTSIPQGYTDLRIVGAVTSTAGQLNTLQFNSDTGSNYSITYMQGDGSSATSGRNTNATSGNIDYTGSTAQHTVAVDVMNYSNTTTYKTWLSRNGNAGTVVIANVGLWRSTAAISTITISNGTSNGILAGSTFSLYGIKAEVGNSTSKATGGTVTSDSTYWYHTFTTSGNFVPNQTLSCDILQVAGGGGANNDSSGGGGAGGLLTYTAQSVTAGSYSVLVGGGGGYGASGTDSQFGTLTASVGGGRGSGIATSYTPGNGGSGGGGSGGGSTTAGTGTAGQGNAGGAGYSAASPYGGGGGGGAGATGNAGRSTSDGAGGIGLTSSLTNAMGAATSTGQLSGGNYYYAGGGGGNGGLASGGVGGTGGGGTGGTSTDQTGSTNGTANTGGGAGGGNSAYPRSGGSGVVIVRYAK